MSLKLKTKAGSWWEAPKHRGPRRKLRKQRRSILRRTNRHEVVEQMNEWQTGAPPNQMPVEVECDGKIITVKSVWGTWGVRPHWEKIDGSVWYHASRFTRWRLL